MKNSLFVAFLHLVEDECVLLHGSAPGWWPISIKQLPKCGNKPSNLRVKELVLISHRLCGMTQVFPQLCISHLHIQKMRPEELCNASIRRTLGHPNQTNSTDAFKNFGTSEIFSQVSFTQALGANASRWGLFVCLKLFYLAFHMYLLAAFKLTLVRNKMARTVCF